MWETFISWYINTYLSHYVENLNAEQLSFALSQGELELENVPLKKNIFRSRGLPLEVKIGVIGKIKIEFNLLKYFRNEPVVVSIDDVFLVAGPLDLTKWNVLDEAAAAHEAKMAALDAQENEWKAKFDATPSYYSALHVSSTRVGASIVTKVVENLHLNIRRVHIRYENEDVTNSRWLAVGFTFESLVVQTAESKGSASFKTLSVGRSGVYCDTNANPLSHSQFKEEMCQIPSHSYLLSPVSADAYITRNTCSTVTEPRFNVSLTLEKVPLSLSDTQYQAMCRQFEALRKLKRNARLRHYRPLSNVVDSPREWWNYSVQAVLSLRGFKRRKKLRTWDETLERARNNVLYVKVYERFLSGDLLTSEEQKFKDNIELDLHYDDILFLRKIVMTGKEKLETMGQAVKVRKSTANISEKLACGTSGLLAWMFPSWSGPNVDATALSPEQSATPDVSVFDDAILNDMQTFGSDVLLARCTFHLNQGVFLLRKNQTDFLELDFGGVSIEVCLKPRSGSHTFQIGLCHLSLRDCYTKQGILVPHFKPISSSSPREPFLFRILYEIKPHKRAAHRVTVLTRPMDLTIFPNAWNNISSFFTLNSEFGDSENLEIQYNGYEAMKQKTKDELLEYWNRLLMTRGEPPPASSAWEIHLDIFAPQILVHPNHNSSSYLVIDLGRFQFTNNTAEKKTADYFEESDSDNDEFLTPCSSPVPVDDHPFICSSGNVIEELDIHSKLYKKYLLDIKDVQVLVVGESNSRLLHLIDKFSIHIEVDRRLVYSEDPLWPALTVVATLPDLTFHLNESKVQVVQAVICAFASSHAPLQPVELSFLQRRAKINAETWDLVAAEFTIRNMSADLQLRGRSIAELQVTGTKATVTRRSPRDTQFSFVIASLLLVDAMQTFGPDYQLLLASHRHVCMDTLSGSFKDSKPSSSVSSVSSPNSVESSYHLPSQLHDVRSPSPSPNDALITVDLVITSNTSPSNDDQLAVLTLHFNNLDVIGNQETLMEISQFIGSFLPSSVKKSDVLDSMEDSQLVLPSSRLQANLEFHRLNVLLLRTEVGHDGYQLARKIATVTTSDSQVNLSLCGGRINGEGFLGGLQVLNLNPEANKYQRVVLRIGQDPLIGPSSDLNDHDVTKSAVRFTYEGPEKPEMSVRMASVIYVHSNLFLSDLKQCVNQVHAPLTTSLKTAASHLGLPTLLGSFTTTTNPNRESLDEEDVNLTKPSSSDQRLLRGIEIDVTINSLSLCIMDDCKDCDVPLLEVSVHSLEIHQSFMKLKGEAECIISGDYYNRSLSGWEPFLEPWKCSIHWKQNIPGQLISVTNDEDFPSRAAQIEVMISSHEVLDINITSTLLSLYSTVRSNWAKENLNQVDNRFRSPFIPFVLKNETGSSLWFSTVVSNSGELLHKGQKGGSRGRGDLTGWIQVPHGDIKPFSFEARGKVRYRNVHGLRTHQLRVRVDGWEEVIPFSIDRVGTYFRLAYPSTPLPRYAGQMELPPTRIVLQISLQGSAQKIVTVRSALQVKNSLEDPVELKLENTIIYPSFERAQTGGAILQHLQPGQTYPLPLHSVWAQMWVRPLIPTDSYPLYYDFCTRALLLTREDGVRECQPRLPQHLPSYRFCVAVRRNEFPADSDDIIPHNSLSASGRANLVTLLSPFKLVNLLPQEISYEVKGQNITGHLPAGKVHCLQKVVTTDVFEILFHIDGFPKGGVITVNPKVITSSPQRVRLNDNSKRPLILQFRVKEERGGVICVVLSCPCWVVNKSGLPLIVKQEGASSEAAGQYFDHEVGRMVTPLMMSFIEQEVPESFSLRVGTGLHKASNSFWCRSIPCQVGLHVRKLTVAHFNKSPESIYMIGVQLKNGVGRYSDTRLVLIYPRFVVDNRSSQNIKISQRCYANSFFDAKAEATHLSLPPSCSLPFHWSRLDKDQLLCVRTSSAWSGGFPIDNVDSFHVNTRNSDGTPAFVRVEIVLQGPCYFVIFSDTSQLPPPFRVDNFSLASLVFHQSSVNEARLKIEVAGETSLPYALDEPTQRAHLTIAAPGGTSVEVDMDKLGCMSYLTYENFFYIAFTGAGRNLVLDVPEGTRVVLREKEDGSRTQLWRVNSDGLIEHDGSSLLPGIVDPLVLDVAGSALQPNQFVPLMLRKPNNRRASTQHWEFTSDGRLKCSIYENLFVQAKVGFTPDWNDSAVESSWHPWNDVVLGPTQPVCHIRTEEGVPVEQFVVRQMLRPGSGVLSVTVDTDGPTRVVRVVDVRHPPRKHIHTFEANDYNTTPTISLLFDLIGGLGISIISCSPRRELMYGRFSGVLLEWKETKHSRTVKASVSSLQIDNQLFEAEKSAVIYMFPRGVESQSNDLSAVTPAFHIYWEEMKSSLNARVFKVFEIYLLPISLILEERLLLHLANWLGLPSHVESLDALQKSDFEMNPALLSSSSLHTRRYYFGLLKLVLTQVKLTVLTTSKLPPQLKAIKRSLGLTLIRFEDANVELDPFKKYHPFETFDFLWTLVVKHYRDELVTQAAVILGSTDFLGNPLGFLNDVSEGVTMMIYEGSVGGLVKNVAHGLSNSAAKVTGTLGEGLGKTILDEKHEKRRRKIKEDHAGTSGEHLYAGFRGLGHGIVGGMTSVITQSYEGIINGGITGLFTGLTKGILGTVTKPAVGVLDLATGAASAIRDSSKTSSRLIPSRIRPSRVAMSNGGLLSVYNEEAARGQELLLELNDRNYDEIFIGCENLKSKDLKVIISSEAVTVFRATKTRPVLLKIPLKELVEVGIVVVSNTTTDEKTPYIELVRQLPELHSAFCRPRVICEIEATARRVVEQINYAKVLYDEMRHSQIDNSNDVDD